MKTDCLIVGGGLAGLYIALQVKNKSVTILSKTDFEETNTYLAQGGIAAEMTNDIELLNKHIKDTLIAGAWHNDKSSTELLVNEASENIKTLISFGVEFDHDSFGQIDKTLEGGHSTRRILHAGGDATGRVIMRALENAVINSKNITIIPKSMATDLIINNGECVGVYYLDEFGKLKNIFANSTVIATGGIGGVYKQSTNPKHASGDGIGLVSRANGVIRDMEFVQFHPTAYYDANSGNQAFLISEAVRGEGAYLVNSNADRFMHKYDERLELAPRDIVSQSIIKEMYNTWNECVYLDTRHLKSINHKRFPTINKNLLKKGIDMNKDLIPVKPVQHYSVGGIKTNLKGETSIKNLYANGECSSTGVHGANRLASNSLLECIVFGNEIAKQINKSNIKLEETKIQSTEWQNQNLKYKPIIREVQEVMEKYVGVVRNLEELKLAESIVQKILNNLSKYTNYTKNYFRVLNIATTSLIIIKSAIERTESIGCHYIIGEKNEN